jgi:hypothetical protein
MENFKEGQELEFDVYGTQIKGKYLSMIDEKVIKIEVTYDSSEVTEVGCTLNVHQSFLVRFNLRGIIIRNMKMEKQVKRFEVPFNFDWTYGVTIEKLRKDLDELEKLGVKEIDIQAEENCGSASVTIEAFIEKEETDEEFQKRVNEETQRQEEIKRRELQQLEQLKSKYGM